MGNPASSGCAPVQPPMPLPQGSGRHRQSLSISSLPLDKLGRINCEKRASVSALSSPAKVALTDTEKLSIATFLGHGHGQGKHHDFSRRTEELYLSKGMELATDDRKPMSFNPFRGHRRVGSGSFTTPCKVYSPRARSGSTSSPKKLDKYAALPFDSPAKLERSMSMSRVAAHRPVAMKGNHGPYQPTNLDLSPSQLTQSGGGERSSSSDSDLAVDMVQEPPRQQASPTAQIIHITKMLAEGEAEQPATIGVEDSPAMELEPHGVDGVAEDVQLSPSSSQSSMMTSMASTESESSGHESPELTAAESEEATIEEEIHSTNVAVDDNSQLLTLATEDTRTGSSLEDGAAAISTEDESLVPFTSTGAREEREMNVLQVPEPRLTVRKRRRSVSASGIGAMLLKVVRVSDSAQIVARRMPRAGSPELILSGVEGLRARKYVLEKTAQIISTGPATHSESSASISSANSTPVHHVCQPVSEDAIKSTYSTFVDIEIDPGGDCIELVQHSKDATQNGSAATFETRQRIHQVTPGPSPRHLQHDQESSCTGMRNDKVDTQTNKHSAFASSTTHTTDDRHSGRRTREPITSRARISSSDLDSLKECLKTGRIADSENETHTANQVLRVSRLQAPSCGAASRVDVFRPVSVLANPLFSSSHQDKLWEEQADIFSSGGRGTPGREDDATMANVMISVRRSPSPAFPCEAHQAAMGESPGTQRGRPPRSVADDPRRRGSPVFIRQIMSRIRGSNSPSPKPHDFAKRRSTSTWSSCICFSVK